MVGLITVEKFDLENPVSECSTFCEVKTWVSPNNRVKISDQKNRENHSWHGEQSKETTRPQKHQLNMDLGTRKE